MEGQNTEGLVPLPALSSWVVASWSRGRCWCCAACAAGALLVSRHGSSRRVMGRLKRRSAGAAGA